MDGSKYGQNRVGGVGVPGFLGEEKEKKTGKMGLRDKEWKASRPLDLVHVLIVRLIGEIICKHLRPPAEGPNARLSLAWGSRFPESKYPNPGHPAFCYVPLRNLRRPPKNFRVS
jgi:hypothetical protein